MSLIYYFEAKDTIISAFLNVCAQHPEGIAVDDQGSTCTFETLIKKVIFFRYDYK